MLDYIGSEGKKTFHRNAPDYVVLVGHGAHIGSRPKEMPFNDMETEAPFP